MLYHGSNVLITGKLIPNISFHYIPYVYATSDWRYALVRSGKFDANKMLFKEDYDGNNYTLIELSPGATEEVFDTGGHIYTVDSNLFAQLQDGMPNEFVSNEPCGIHATQYIQNILPLILSNPFYRIIRYGTEDEREYWKTVRGGRDGYLERRAARLKQL